MTDKMSAKSLTGKLKKRLRKEYETLEKNLEDGTRYQKDDMDMYKCHIYLSKFDEDTIIAKDLEKYNVKEVHFEITLPERYPFAPPFVRIVTPRFLSYVGFITSGGSLCLDLLTASSWSPAYTIDALLIQIKIFIKDGKIDPKNANGVYTMAEAKQQYDYTTKVHGWGKKT